MRFAKPPIKPPISLNTAPVGYLLLPIAIRSAIADTKKTTTADTVISPASPYFAI
jgi:hypothetical protein